MRWTVHSETPLYRDEWLDIRLADVELPDGRRLAHRTIHMPPGAGAVITDNDRALLIWRHRFITDTWGWEIPIGKINPGEEPADAAAREVEEETGWRPAGPLRPLIYTQPSSGLLTSEHHIFTGHGATDTGPAESWEAQKVEWVPLTDIRRLVDDQTIVSGTTLVALLYLLTQR